MLMEATIFLEILDAFQTGLMASREGYTIWTSIEYSGFTTVRTAKFDQSQKLFILPQGLQNGHMGPDF